MLMANVFLLFPSFDAPNIYVSLWGWITFSSCHTALLLLPKWSESQFEYLKKNSEVPLLHAKELTCLSRHNRVFPWAEIRKITFWLSLPKGYIQFLSHLSSRIDSPKKEPIPRLRETAFMSYKLQSQKFPGAHFWDFTLTLPPRSRSWKHGRQASQWGRHTNSSLCPLDGKLRIRRLKLHRFSSSDVTFYCGWMRIYYWFELRFHLSPRYQREEIWIGEIWIFNLISAKGDSCFKGNQFGLSAMENPIRNQSQSTKTRSFRWLPSIPQPPDPLSVRSSPKWRASILSLKCQGQFKITGWKNSYVSLPSRASPGRHRQRVDGGAAAGRLSRQPSDAGERR